jgi:hypothetical protein
MSGRARFAVALAAAFVLVGCATGYQQRDITGGYEEHEVSSGVWRILYSGNGYVSYETVQTYWLYRAAEITLQKGYDGFEIINSSHLASAESAIVPVLQRNDPEMMHKPWFIGEIRMLHKPFTARPPKVFDATTLKAKLAPLVNAKQLCGGNVCPHLHSYLMPDI